MATKFDPSPNPAPQPKKRKRRPNALADHVQDWVSLIGAAADHAATLAPIDAHRAALAESLDRVRATKSLQESHRASQQAATQLLTEAVAEAQERALRLRGAIRAELGTTTEQLTQFGICPLRHRPLRHRSNPGTIAPSPSTESVPE